MDINYGVLMPPPRRSARKLQVMILSGVGFVALTAIIMAIVFVRAYSPQAAPLGSQVPTPAVAMTQTAPIAPAVAPSPAPQAPAAQPPQVSDAKEKDEKVAKAGKDKKRRAARPARRAKAPDKGAPSDAGKPKKKADDELKRLLGI